jgi:agmatine deiminase
LSGGFFSTFQRFNISTTVGFLVKPKTCDLGMFFLKLPLPPNLTQMRTFFLGLLCTALCCACQPKNKPKELASEADPSPFRQHAEYEPNEAVWLLWPQMDHLASMPNAQVTLKIIEALQAHTKVKLVVPNDSIETLAKSKINAKWLENKRVQVFQFPYQEFWARDMGPAFVVNEQGKLAMADFNFNAWEYTQASDPVAQKDEKLDERIAAKLGIPVLSTNLITEGGNHEVSSKGVLMLSEVVAKGRNPEMSRAQMEAEYRRVLGVKKFIWLQQGLYEDDHTFNGPIKGPKGEKLYTVLTTNGHTDEMARFVNDSTILLASVDSSDLSDPINQENARRLSENLKILREARNVDGKPFKIVPMPSPKLITSSMKPGDGVYEVIRTFVYKDESAFPQGQPVKVVAAASYLNFLVANDAVLVPYYYRPGGDLAVKKLDEAAQKVLKSVFPKKKIIPIDALAINFGGGGIHCITINEPKL